MKLCWFLLTLLLAQVPAGARDAATRHYWDMDTLDAGVPVDVVGGLAMTAGGNLALANADPAGGSGGNYLETSLGSYGVPLTADVHDGNSATAMVFAGDFAFSYWSYNVDDGDVRGPRVFDSLSGTSSGIQLAATNATPSIFNFRTDSDDGGEVLSNNELALSQATGAWTLIVVNMDRVSNLGEIFFNGVSQGTYDISAVSSGNISPSQDLQIGCINGGTNAGGLEGARLDDLAFYEGLLSAREITDLHAGTITPDDLADTTPPADPTGLTLLAGNGTVTLDWNDNTEPDLADYRIYRRTEASEARLVGSSATSGYLDTGLHNGFAYTYFVTAADLSGGESGGSNEVEGTPAVPGAGSLADLSATHFEDCAGFPHVTALPADFLADSDGDGEPDPLEYALGSDKHDPASLGSSTIALDPGDGSPPVVTYHERISSPTVHVSVSFSTDLENWSSHSLTELGRVSLPDGRTEEVTVRLDDPALAASPRGFVRVRVDAGLNVPRFAIVPEATTTSTVSMTAGEADLDPRTVEYFFEAVSGGGNDSGWQRGRLHLDAGLAPGGTYAYRVRIRQVNPADGTPVPGSETGYSRIASATTPAAGSRPNIIVFMADDLGYECFDIYGDSDHDTPEITRMADEGVKFTNFHSQPLCTPSRVQIMSGQYNQRSGTTFGDYEPDKCFATFFKQAGYRTCIAGKWQLDYRVGGDPATNPALPQRVLDLGFDEFLLWNISGGNSSYYGSRYWSPKLYTNPASPGGNFTVIDGTSSQYGPTLVRDFINNFAATADAASEPFLIYCPLIDPHDPFVTPPGYSGLATDKAKHQAMVEYMDQSVGTTLDLIRTTPSLAGNTLVLFIADNGTSRSITPVFNGANYPGGKAGTFDPGTHVPFVAWGPGIPAGSVSNDLADMTDILPTICDVAGVPGDPDYVTDGRSLRTQLHGHSRDPRRWVYGYYYDSRNPTTRRMAWVRNKHFKLYQDGLDHTGSAYVGATRGHLYDVINDERETSPLPDPPAGSRLEALRNEFQAVLDRMDEDTDPGNN